MSRADLSRTLGLTRVTVSDLVSDLLERGHVVELGQSDEVRPGKPAILVDINRQGLQVIGMDLAENSVLRAAVLDLDGNILERVERTLSEETGQDVVNEVLALASEAKERATATLLGIGVGTPGIVNADGVVTTAPNFEWKDVALRDLLQEHTGLPTLVSNDADAAVHADYTFGGGSDDMVLVKIGRGVGSGLIVGGRRARGAHSAAGEIGHVTVGTDGGTTCKCGKTGCLETWMSVPSLERALTEAAASSEPEAAADVVLREAGERLAIALAPVVGALDLGEVVLSGPRGLLEGPLLNAVQQTLLERLLHQDPSPVSVRLAADAQDIVLRGAAVMVLWNQLGVA
ncbi:ROK family transcriptional regulator [Arthrobacter sp. B2a2-09]|nr:ROK family transcriptional regulator [Arthrobacter sp. B2a2-09]